MSISAVGWDRVKARAVRAGWSTTRSPRVARAYTASAWAHLPIDVAPEVEHALRSAEGAAVLAMESALITHGLPLPHAYSLPQQCGQLCRDRDVVPASIGLIDGRIKVGLSDAQCQQLAELGQEKKATKVGRRELASTISRGLSGGTTVSATMHIAHLVGIKVFATGGIGGVHRGASESFDISPDLRALASTPVAVVCSGCKSILDIGLTLEYLETLSVPVATFQTSRWPAFYSPDSGFASPLQLDTLLDVAKTLRLQDEMGITAGLLLGVPIPQEFHAEGQALQRFVDQAVQESIENGMSRRGKDVTPWLLQRVSELSSGRSVKSSESCRSCSPGYALIKRLVRYWIDKK